MKFLKFNIVFALLIAGVIFFIIFRPEQNVEGANPLNVEKPADDPQVAEGNIQKALSEIPAGKKIIVHKELRSLVPDSLQTFSFLDSSAGNYQALIPDTRMNPIEADYALIYEGGHTWLATGQEGSVWEIIAKEQLEGNVPRVLLRKNEEALKKLIIPKKGNEKLLEVSKDGERFKIEKYEVSCSDFASFLNEIDMPFEQAFVYISVKDIASNVFFVDGKYKISPGLAKYPVVLVSYVGARAYCDHYKMKLPNVDQWYLASGLYLDNRRYPWGEENDVIHRANFLGGADHYNGLAPVDAFPKGKSPFGAYNMFGNVYEWVDGGGLLGGAWEIAFDENMGFVQDTNDMIARNTHDGFRCVSNE